MKTAVIAHYSHLDRWESNLLLLVRSASKVFDNIILVTTQRNVSSLPLDLSHVRIIRRPNIGYDFYSYRVGIRHALENGSTCDCLALLNSSFYVVNSDKFTKALRMLTSTEHSSGVRSITRSGQFSDHLQSYALAIDFSVVSQALVLRFFDCVEPENTKLQTILKYEVGFGQFLRANGVSYKALFKPSVLDRFSGFFRSLKFCIWEQWIKESKGFSLLFPLTGINWSHFAANRLAECYGIAKAELLRQNPYFLPINNVLKGCQLSISTEVYQSISRSKPYYCKSDSGLSEFCAPDLVLEQTILEFIDSPQKRVSTNSVAVVLHLFYIELLDELFSYLNNIIEPFDLYVTSPFAADIPIIIEKSSLRGIPATVVYIKNKGRDVGPFIALYRSGKLDKYDAVLKIHTKKSLYSEEGSSWRNELLVTLCGSSLVCLSSIDLIRNKKVGILGPKQFFLSHPRYWGANRSEVVTILNNCGIERDENSVPLGFFAGSMFWFNPSAFKKLNSCLPESLSFEDEEGLQDGTLAHAWERAFCLIANEACYVVSSADDQGACILGLASNYYNSVPVLRGS